MHNEEIMIKFVGSFKEGKNHNYGINSNGQLSCHYDNHGNWVYPEYKQSLHNQFQAFTILLTLEQRCEVYTFADTETD